MFFRKHNKNKINNKNSSKNNGSSQNDHKNQKENIVNVKYMFGLSSQKGSLFVPRQCHVHTDNKKNKNEIERNKKNLNNCDQEESPTSPTPISPTSNIYLNDLMDTLPSYNA